MLIAILVTYFTIGTINLTTKAFCTPWVNAKNWWKSIIFWPIELWRVNKDHDRRY